MSDPKNQPSIPPVLGLILGLFAVSTASVLIRLGQGEAPSIVIAAGRLGIASLILAPAAFFRVRQEICSFSKRQWGLVILSGAFLAVHFAAWITSLENTSIASSVVLVTTTPLWVALAAPVFLKEKISRMVLIGLGVALAGGVIVGIANACEFREGVWTCQPIETIFNGRAMWGNFLALVGAWMAAGYLLVGRKIRQQTSLLAYIFPVYSVAAVVLVFWMVASGYGFGGYAPQTYLWLFLLALFPQIIGHSTYNWALGYLPAAFVSVALLGEPVGTMILAVILLGEIPAGLELIGGAMILLGIYISTRS